MNNNVDFSTSYNPIETSIQKVLREPKTALIMFEKMVPAVYKKCLVSFSSTIILK